ncbi:inactive leucine-rich repeat receptor-like protein kinase [Acorus gramineus]|uniref:Inactive leucine-rich repeat receptor-like protein kinase n=1 Tax=Acorus gramineus TaxID=55184 RepID=A0AAV9API3_ACOGR|nr:inactive leucine-rich repeat receptor-like protein kinase [Acorus gramineus]
MATITTTSTHSLPLTLLLLLLSLITIPTTPSSDAEFLLTFKSSMKDSSHSLSKWSPTTTFCNWTGIICSSSSTTPIVTSISLPSLTLSGDFSSLCHLPNLTHLDLSNNLFNQPIPLSLSHCTSLEYLNLSRNSFWGTLPDQMSQLSLLTVLDLSHNSFEGQVPVNLGSLKRLQVLILANNSFSGSVSSSVFANLTELLLLDLSLSPSLASELPKEVAKLVKLKKVFLQRSNFYGQIPDSFLGLDGLEVLDLSQNNLTGRIPLGFGLGLKNLVFFDVSQNSLSGSFPLDICYGKRLVDLNLHTNSFTGLVSVSLERCSSLERFQVQNNGFWGDLPSGLWSLTNVKLIRAENNRFSSEIPPLISTHLEQIQIDNNNFTGRIPRNLGLLKNMYRFSASLNSLYGELPSNFCGSPVLSIVNLSHNSLSGPIPNLGSCRKLVSLALADNSLTGEIPNSLAQLPVLTYIDLSHNNLTGEIPQELQNLKLALFNVSYNGLSGRVPFTLVSGLPASYLEGNPGLCGPGLPNSCGSEEKLKKQSAQNTRAISALISIAFALGVLMVSAGFFAIYRTYQHRKLSQGQYKLVFFYPLRITEEDLKVGMDEKSVIGGGAFGKVYMVRIPGGEFIAVKKLIVCGNLSLKSLKAEIKILAKARHVNIVKLLGFGVSEDSVLLMYEYLRRGSLGDAICRPDFCLDWNQRLRIALGVARGLAYLHKDYVPHLLHRNVKSNNVLLDEDFEAKITDFGIDRIIGESAFRSSSTASGPGSNCYIAPEFECVKKAAEEMDVYGYGVILLELITGRPVEQPEFSRDYVDVVKWVRRKVNTANGANKILDQKISNESKEGMSGALEIALRCTSVLPENRPSMFEVIRSLQSLNS